MWGEGWPEGLTLEQNLIDLGWHQKEFQRRRSFAYTVVKDWVATKWPFKNAAFPGIDMPEADWDKLPENKR